MEGFPNGFLSAFCTDLIWLLPRHTQRCSRDNITRQAELMKPVGIAISYRMFQVRGVTTAGDIGDDSINNERQVSGPVDLFDLDWTGLDLST